ncbi:histone H1-gamma, late-like [Patiria miniata]|uniref:H15 domain-containing protein n=1 Tax=Patiria miniata TaxID=46514 RepID=A0A914AQW8_PATMI|nr:histone H1-gamma, late-like [Patiria miniata]
MADSTVTESMNGKAEGTEAPKKARSARPSTLDKVVEALQACNDNPRKGTSVKAIKTWIDANYPDSTATHKTLLRKALETGMARQLIERPKKDNASKGVLMGFYRPTKPKPAPKAVKKANPKAKLLKKAKADAVANAERRSRSATPKGKKSKPVPRARARSVSATPRVSKSKKIRSRLSKSHSPLRTPKLIKPKAKATAAGRKKTATSPALAKTKTAAKTKKSPAKKAAKKSPAAKAASPGKTTAKKTTKAAKPAAKAAGKTTTKDGGKKKK